METSGVSGIGFIGLVGPILKVEPVCMENTLKVIIPLIGFFRL